LGLVGGPSLWIIGILATICAAFGLILVAFFGAKIILDFFPIIGAASLDGVCAFCLIIFFIPNRFIKLIAIFPKELFQF
jgi:hypothetical protein